VTQFAELLRILATNQVEFILVGGVAAAAHGSPRVTQDLDILYRRNKDNIAALVRALSPYHPYLRGAPPGLPFRFDEVTVRAGLNFTLVTSLGSIDLFGMIPGGDYDELVPHCLTVEVFGIQCKVLDLETLISTKKAAGRPKDFEALAELESIRDRRKSHD
jgi:predicted nucleotidyltransferase